MVNIIERFKDDPEFLNMYAQALEDELRVIKEKYRWIPIKEKRPEPNQPVLVQWRNIAHPPFIIVMDEDGEWALVFKSGLWFALDPPTHWRPLSPGPKEE